MSVPSLATEWGTQASPPTTNACFTTATSHLGDLSTVTTQLLHTVHTTRLHLTFYHTPGTGQPKTSVMLSFSSVTAQHGIANHGIGDCDVVYCSIIWTMVSLSGVQTSA